MVFSNIFQDMMHFVYAAFVVVEFFFDYANLGANSFIFEVVIFDMCPDVGEWATAAWTLQKKWQNGASLRLNLKLVLCRDDT